jgi:hypothetical protein
MINMAQTNPTSSIAIQQGGSQFFKGMAKAAKMGYKWRIGNGRKV